MRTKIEKKGQLCTLHRKREKKKEEKRMIVSDSPTTIHHHVPNHVEEDTVVYSNRWWKVKFGHRVVLHALPEWRGRHTLPSAC
jgi:seryl-tRNA synthetase